MQETYDYEFRFFLFTIFLCIYTSYQWIFRLANYGLVELFFSQKKETPNDNNLTKIYHFERVCVACVDVKMCVVMEYFTKFTI